MNIKMFFIIFGTVFLAELGDKTQLATLLYAGNKENSKLFVFLASSSALVLASGLAVLVGTVIEKYVNPRCLSWLAGIGFIVIGMWTITKK
jgi:putative Ca2+/H+ antiporter (TMEM165/GDT1 family)